MRVGFLFTISILFAIGLSISQSHPIAYRDILTRYIQIEKEYQQTTELGKRGLLTEQEEEQRNTISLQKFQDLKSQLNVVPGGTDSLSFFVYYRIGELQHYFYFDDEALTYYKQAIELKKRTKTLPDSLLFKPYLFTGSILYTKHKFDSAMLYYKQAEKILVEYDNKLDERERLYNTLGAMYYETGNYRLARNYLLKAIEVLPISDPYYKELLVNYKINLASVLNKLEEYDEANKIYQDLLKTKINRNEILHNIGSINLALGSANTALSYFRRVNYSSSRKLNLYNDMAAAFLNLERLDSANYYLERSLQLNDSIYGNNTNVPRGLTFKYLGELQFKYGRKDRSLEYFQLALHQFYPAYNNDSVSSNPDKFSGLFSYINLFSTLVNKADVLHALYEEKHDQHWAELELKTWHSAFKLADYVERSYESDEARLFLNKNKYVIHNKPIATAYELYKKYGKGDYLEQVYYFDQKNKASVLSLNHHTISTVNGHLEQEEHQLKSAITRLSLQADRVTDSINGSRINKEIRDLEIELGKVQRENVSSVVNNERVPTIKQVQKLLDKKTAIISYHLSDSSFVAVAITSSDVTSIQKRFYSQFEINLQQFISELRNLLSDHAAITTLSKQLYSFLIAGVIPSGIDRLIIIPDDELNYLPFEALSDLRGNYLITNHSVQYQYATSLLKKEKLDLVKAKTIALAPFASSGFTLEHHKFLQLPASAKEVKNTKGEILLGSKASKSNFINSLADYRIVHLATHAVANDTTGMDGYIAFYPSSDNIQNNLLYEKEIYNLQLKNTDLVILSACETGAGSLVKGEGVMSMSRAFAYAGCPNIVTSLWKADDATTALLMERFHFYIKEGMSADKALQETKKYLLGNPLINPRMKHPSYWANFIYIGNFEPANKSWLWLLIPIFTLLILLFVLKKVPLSRDRRSSKGA